MRLTSLLNGLGVAISHSRPRVSDDNPYSEAQFKTLKYHATFPERFGSLEDGKSFFANFFQWYNNVHRHSGISMLTPSTVHSGRANDLLEAPYMTMRAADAANPDRFIAGEPRRAVLANAV